MKFLNQAADAPDIDSLNVTHLAVGTGTSTPAVTDTQLQTESFRKAVATKTRAARYFQASTVLAATEANGTLTEVAVFADGTGVANSGTLLSRAAISKVKNSNIVLNIYWRLTLEQE